MLKLTFVHPDPRVEQADQELTEDEEFDALVAQRVAFWESSETKAWFETHGYTLYKPLHTGANEWLPRIPSAPVVKAEYPYAHHESGLLHDRDQDRLARGSEVANIIFAQDGSGHHVAIKLVPHGTEELKIYKFLHNQPLSTTQENCVLPVLEILPIEGHSFVVMPRWGMHVVSPWPETMGAVARLIRDLLKGLAFLHRHGIIHRDLCFANALVNHFSGLPATDPSSLRSPLRSENQLSYAWMDFDVSILVPPTTDRTTFRLPYKESYLGRGPHPYDTTQGELDYDPFAFDVGALGVTFCNAFQHLSRDLPLLAPLLDGMTTRFIAKRFTAAQALDFLEARLAETPVSELENAANLPPQEGTEYDDYNRWEGLPSDFVEKWAVYRQSPVPLWVRFVRDVYFSRFRVLVLAFCMAVEYVRTFMG
ncbi:hypothetical protein BKA70DRAFT_506662 [Coprinopsis sp. MPI-PUGE-AT-0042]|nr:hypothetical protein BKA70DRAFT_506662 [Coprinopsis sp. MPI-PUGE-AT-0042]